LTKGSLIIDTSFIMPTLGVDIGEEVLKCISLFDNYDIFYIEASILEAMWKLVKLIRNDEDMVRVMNGLEAVKSKYHLIIPTPQEYIYAYKVYSLGHRDYIDALLYSVSYMRKKSLLTLDMELIQFIRENGLDARYIITPTEFLKK